MHDKIIGFFAFAVLTGFLAILVGFVTSIDLIIVIVFVLLLAGYDFYRSIFMSRSGSRRR